MGRTTEVAIAAVPVAICMAIYFVLNMPAQPVAAADAVVLPSALASSSASRSGFTQAPALSQTAPTPPAAVTIRGADSPDGPLTARPTVLPTGQATTGPEVSGTLVSGILVSGTLHRGRELAGLLYTQRLTQLWGTFQPSVRREWGGWPSFQAYRAGGRRAYGAETRVLAEHVRQAGGVSYYTRTATFERGPRTAWTLIFGLDSAGQVIDFGIVAAHVLPGSGG